MLSKINTHVHAYNFIVYSISSITILFGNFKYILYNLTKKKAIKSRIEFGSEYVILLDIW